MNPLSAHLQRTIAPGLRGAFFYAAYWGTVGLMEPFLNVYYLSLGIDASRIGMLSAVLPLCTLVVAPLVTRLADYTRRRVVFLAASCLLMGAALTLPYWPFFRPTFLGLIAFVALYAVFRSPIVALADSLIASMAQRHALEFGSMRLWGSVIFTFTAVGMGAVWAQTGYSTMFLSAGLMFLPVAFVALILDEPGGEEGTTKNTKYTKGEEKRGVLEGSPVGVQQQVSVDQLAMNQPAAAMNQPAAMNRAMRNHLAAADHPAEVEAFSEVYLTEAVQPPAPAKRGIVLELGVVFLLCANFLAIAALQMAGTFGTVYMKQIGGAGAMIGAVMGISALGEVPGMLFGSRISRRLGDTTAIIIGFVLISIGMAGYAFTRSPWMVLACSALRGLGFGQLLVSTIMIINTRAPSGYAATYQGILNAACWGLAPLLGGPAGGWIYQNLGASTLFLTAAGLNLASVALITPTYRLWKRK